MSEKKLGNPFKSKAQMERLRSLIPEGKVTQEYFDACLAATPNVDDLPERLHPKKEKPKAEDAKAEGTKL